MAYKDKLAKALELNKNSTIIFYGVKLAPGKLIQLMEILNDEGLSRQPGQRW